jgi:hypothetical protein
MKAEQLTFNSVMMPNSPNPAIAPNSIGDFAPQYPLRDIFNFGIDANLDFNDLDFGWINSQNSWNLHPCPENIQTLERGQQTPNIRNGLTVSSEAFERSLWRWAPQKQDHGLCCFLCNLPLR